MQRRSDIERPPGNRPGAFSLTVWFLAFGYGIWVGVSAA